MQDSVSTILGECSPLSLLWMSAYKHHHARKDADKINIKIVCGCLGLSKLQPVVELRNMADLWTIVTS